LVFIGFTISTTHTKGVELVAVAVTIAFWQVRTAALINLSWTIAYTASIQIAYAVVHIVTDAVRVLVSLTIAATYAEGVELVAIAVAVSRGNVRTTALVDFTWPIAHTASIQIACAVVHVVADAVAIFIGLTCATAFPERVFNCA
jgi:hypothetical protein